MSDFVSSNDASAYEHMLLASADWFDVMTPMQDWGGDGLHRMHAKAMAFLRLGEDSAILSLLEA